MPTEDHPLEYADFEGVIPAGEYGGGTVLVWDRGVYRNLQAEKEASPKSMAQALAEGHAEVWLEGHKLKGGYALIRTGQGQEERWLMVKRKDDEADARRNVTGTEPESVLSGRSLAEIKAEEEKPAEI